MTESSWNPRQPGPPPQSSQQSPQQPEPPRGTDASQPPETSQGHGALQSPGPSSQPNGQDAAGQDAATPPHGQPAVPQAGGQSHPAQSYPAQPYRAEPHRQAYEPQVLRQPQQNGCVRRVPLVVAVVAGLVLGGGGVGLTWWLTSGPGEGAEADAAAACAVAERVEPGVPSEKNMGEYRRWAAAVELANAAAEEDPALEQFAEAFAKPYLLVRQTMADDTPEFRQAVTGMRAACDDL
ncbi:MULTISPECIES: hypothetical protein [Prauserella salsuginis group]|uniref:Uncharacterized protein n=2 Tax=Prauserella salsuginis group TaxID=2893672 RepID=A0A839XKF8_9PSEU|nr:MULTISPECIES: hypothetical protein [Prauserella salsuginis group]MBB3662004.1 hypothetical protein [Prauserella sediminis]MCR3719703.1 hypothetical protein [Prauserella flava]MCR3736754.1 hypothetical protein [Prauserella salsuginis]